MIPQESLIRLYNINLNDYFRLQGIFSAFSKLDIPKIIYTPRFKDDVILDIVLPPELLCSNQIKSKQFYDVLIREKYERPLSTFRIQNRYLVSDKELSLARSSIFTTTIDVRYREFQFKVLNNILILNYKLYKMKLINSPLCTFCKSENETTEHLFWNCTLTKVFWNELSKELIMFDFSFLTEQAVILGLLIKYCWNDSLNVPCG